MMTIVETTTSWGSGLPLDKALSRILMARPDTTHIELSVGATAGDVSVLDQYPDITFLGHHTLPLGSRCLRPVKQDRDELLDVLQAAGITRYTAHPPHQKFTRGLEGFHQWCESWWNRLQDVGIEFAVETMYTPRTREDRQRAGGYFLSTPGEVWDFVAWADSIGWRNPLVLDASHLFIGWSAGTWTEQDVLDLLVDGPADELHVSQNDGRRDLHRPLSPTHKVSSWVTPDVAARFAYVVPEGKHPIIKGES